VAFVTGAGDRCIAPIEKTLQGMAAVQVLVEVDQSGNDSPSIKIQDSVCGLRLRSGGMEEPDLSILQ